MQHLMAIGLTLDISGVLFLGAALMTTADRQISAQAGTYFNYSRPLLKSLVFQRADARIGLPMLLAGFSCQLASVVGLYLNANLAAAAWIMIVAVALGAAISRPHLAELRYWVLVEKLKKQGNVPTQ
jgi:hypothetical protein